MRRKFQAGLLATAIMALSACGASAQTTCDNGYVSAKGDCVSKLAADIARQRAVIFSQPKISETAYPVLPSGDSAYRYPNQLNNIPNSGVTPIGRVPPPSE